MIFFVLFFLFFFSLVCLADFRNGLFKRIFATFFSIEKIKMKLNFDVNESQPNFFLIETKTN